MKIEINNKIKASPSLQYLAISMNGWKKLCDSWHCSAETIPNSYDLREGVAIGYSSKRLSLCSS